jgi:hypothetical protein
MTLHTFSELQQRLANLGTAVEKSRKATLEKAALKAKETIAAGAPARLRNVGKSGAKLTVRYTLEGDSLARMKAVGPWPLVEVGSKPHTIRPKKKGGRKAILTPSGPRASVQHPGTKAKRLWSKGVEKAEPLALAELNKETFNTVVAAFKG